MNKATFKDWKVKTLPELRQALGFEAFYYDDEAEKIQMGFIPKEMDNRWFICSEEGWVYFYRSWSGECIYAIKLDGNPAGVIVTDSWVNSSRRSNTEKDLKSHREIVGTLVNKILLSQ